MLLGARSTVILGALLAAASCAPPQAARARTLLDQGSFAAAERELRPALRKHPDNKELLGLRFRLLVGRGKPRQAIAAYRGAARGVDRRLLVLLSEATIWAALRHRDPRIRLAGIQAARRADTAGLVGAMKARLTDPNALVRTWAAVALSRTRIGADVLGKQLRSSSRAARAVAVRQVGRIARGAAFDVLDDFVKDPAADVRAACARSLGLTGRQQAAKLLARLARDPAREVRHAAILALGTLGKRAGAGGAAAARRALRDPYPPVRHAAIATLARLRGARARPTLRRIAAGDDLRSALHAGRALARHDEPQPVLDAIAKALVDRDWTLRAAAVNTASQVDDKVAWQLVVKALRDRQPAVRLAAARTLLAHGLDSSATLAAARRVLALSCGRKPSLCIQAAEIVGRQGSAAGPRRLRSLARSAKRWRHRRAALEAAQRREWGTPQISIARLADAEPRVALAAASYLYRRYR